MFPKHQTQKKKKHDPLRLGSVKKIRFTFGKKEKEKEKKGNPKWGLRIA
jgi:hypothetical protein